MCVIIVEEQRTFQQFETAKRGIYMICMRKKTAAAALAAVILLSGCSEGSISRGSTTTITASASAFTSTSSTRGAAASAAGSAESRSGAPTVIAPNFLGSSSTEANVPETPGASMNETPEVSKKPEAPEAPSFVPGENEIDTIEYNERYAVTEELHIASGKALVVEGELNVQGGTVVVDDGGQLYVAGKITMYGDDTHTGTLIVSEEGTLSMMNSDAVIEGGVLEMRCDFDNLNCEIGTVKSFIKVPEQKVTDGVTTVGGIVIANKAIKLPPEFGDHLSLDEVEPEVYEALAEMNENSDHKYVNKSGYRSYWDQKAIFQNYCDMYGYEEADTFSSQAGHSEHQTGLTMDLDDFEESYGDTPEGIWLAENCWRYGFVIRYPKGKEYITGYTYEPWHVRWLGKSTAKLLHDSGYETLEEFLNVPGGTTVID